MYLNYSPQFQFPANSVFKKQTLKKGSFVLALSLFLSGCNDNKPDVVLPVDPVLSTLDADIRSIIITKNLTGDPSTGRILPDIKEPKAQLGMKLFFTKSLGGDFDSACVTCHHPVLGGDDLALAIGVDADVGDLLGPGRIHSGNGEHFDGGPTVPRNSPTTFNVALWDNFLFHDDRLESLGKTPKMGGDDDLGIRTPDVPFGESDSETGQNLVSAQARFPVTSKEEMKNFSNFEGTNNAEVRQNLAQRLGDYGNPLGGMLIVNNWLTEFKEAFSAPDGTAEELITFDNITHTIEIITIGQRKDAFIYLFTAPKRTVHSTLLSLAAVDYECIFWPQLYDSGP